MDMENIHKDISDNEAAIASKNDGATREKFIKEHERFILNEAYKACHRFITKSDDEWDTALLAFNEAIDSYDDAKGAFLSFSSIVIKSRIADYYRHEGRHSGEMCVEPEVFDGEVEEDDPEAAGKMQIAFAASAKSDTSARDEIEAINITLKEYGISFFELAACSPKKDKAKHDCAKAAAAMLRNRALIERMRRTRLFPMAEIMKITGLPRKILENHRKYLIAAVEIMDGDYPVISEYMNYIREEMGS